MYLINKMTVLKRTIIWLSAIAMFSFAILIFIGWEVRETIRHNGLHRIHTILNHKIEAIDNYVQQRYISLGNITELFYFASRHHPIFERDFWNHSPESLRNKLAIIAHKNGFYDIFLISLEGDIVYTLKREDDLHTNLLTGRYHSSQLARVFKDALKNSSPYVSDFYFYEASHDYAAFIAEPIIHNGKIIGITAVQIDNKAIQTVINDTRELGKTGEVITSVLENKKMVSMFISRHTQVSQRTFSKLPHDYPIYEAVRGGSGQKYMVDQTGDSTVVAWGYQKDLRCGMMVKMDESELLQEWNKQTTSLLLLFFFGIVIVFSMLLAALRSFAKPIQELRHNALMISSGHYDIAINSNQYDQEWQLLIHAFQQMAIEIKHKITQLNETNIALNTKKSELEELNVTLEARIEAKTHKLQELAITDSMTGLYNRRHYLATIQEEMNRAKRHNSSMALMMLDVDYFKRYNDTYGHQAGDDVLIRIAQVLKLYTSRSGDYAFRLGGEEFALLVSDMSDEEYFSLGHRILNEIETLAILHEKNDVSAYVTISMGIFVYSPESGLTYEELYKEADDQLYVAKNQGRNQVILKNRAIAP